MSTNVRRPTHSWLLYMIMGVIAITCLVIGTVRTSGPSTAEDRVNNVAKTIKCPTCQGESVADSNASASREIRTDIADRLTRGETDDQIRAAYADRYGEAILLTPSGSGVTALVWALPVLVLAGAIAGLIIAFRRWRNAGELHATEADKAIVGRALSELESKDPS